MKKNKTTKGFILMEAIIAVGVLITVFVAATSLHIASVKGIRTTNNQLVATFLAQDAMEYIVAKRQYNFEYDLNWLNGMNNCTAINPCRVSFDDDIISPINNCATGGGSCDLLLTGGGEYFSNDGATAGATTLFSREIVISSGSFEAKVYVTVIWKDGSNTNEYKLVHVLYDNPN